MSDYLMEAIVSADQLDRAFIREVHHQVKNNLQVVCSLLRLQGREVDDPIAREVFKRSEQRIQTMALVYDKLYRCDEGHSVHLREYLQDLTRQLTAGAISAVGSPKVVLEADEVMVSSKAATTLGLLVGEVVSTQLRGVAALGELGVVLVSVKRSLDTVVLAVSSEANGQSDVIESKVVERQIIDALARQLSAQLERCDGVQRSVRVTIPYSTIAAVQNV
jgi:two-component sensor histidine kinase